MAAPRLLPSDTPDTGLAHVLYVLRLHCPADGFYAEEAPFGHSLVDVIETVRGGTTHDLHGIHEVDIRRGTCCDVTSKVLSEVVAYWRDEHDEDVPGTLADACDAYHIERHTPSDRPYRDRNAEHRLTARDVLRGRRAA